MNAPFAATLLCLCVQASAMATLAADPASHAPRARDVVAAAPSNNPATVAMAPVADAGAMLRTMSPRDVQNRRGSPAPAATPGVTSDQVNVLTAPTPSKSPEDGHLLLVGLALMIGIAVRRWGTDSR